MSRLAMVAACVLLAMTSTPMLAAAKKAAPAKNDATWTACTSSSDPAQKIAGCRDIIARGTSETANRRAIAYNNIGNVQLIQNSLDEALRSLDTALLIDPGLAAAYVNRGNVYRNKGDIDRALADLNRGLELNPKSVAGLQGRGAIYNTLRDYDRALKDLDLALQLAPADGAAFAYRSISWSGKTNFDAAIADAERAISINPNFAFAFLGRGNGYQGKNDFARALESFDKAIALSPRFVTAYVNRGILLLGSGDWRRASVDFEEAFRINPKSPFALNGRGLAAKAAGNLTAALADFDEAIRLDSKLAAPYAHRGDLLLKMGELERARSDLETAIRLDPGLAQARVSRGLLYEREGDADRARKEFQVTASLPLRTNAITSRAARELALAKLAGVSPTMTPAAAAQTSPPQVLRPAVRPQGPVAGEKGPRVALVIGNAAYRDVSPLPNPVNDARLIAQSLRDLGFKVIEGHDLDSNAMRAKIAEFGGSIAGASVTLFFYAGHGMQVAGKNYLVPIDAKLERPSALNTEAVEVGTVLADMEAERRVNLVFLDACRDNPMAAKMARSLGASRSSSVNQGLSQQSAGIGTLIAFATSPDTVALDGEGADSPFTLAIVKHINTPGLEIRSMLTRVRADVIAATREQQVPWDHSSLTGEFYFRP